MYSTILVPLDGSPLGERALPVALALARRSRSRVELVHVHRPVASSANAPMYDNRLDDEVEQRTRERISAITESLVRDEGVTATAVFLRGNVASALDEHAAARGGVDLIVMTTHGRGGFSRFWLGSIADALIRRTSVPLLLVRPDPEDTPDAREPIFRRVLVPLDGSARAEEVLGHAAALGSPGATEFLLLTVVTSRVVVDPFPSLATMADREDLAQLIEAERARAGEYLARVGDSFREIGATVSTSTVVNAHPASGILEFAREHAIDLVVLSTHVRTATERILIGSVADKVVRGARAPVLICGPRVVPAPPQQLRGAGAFTSSEREARSTDGHAHGVSSTSSGVFI